MKTFLTIAAIMSLVLVSFVMGAPVVQTATASVGVNAVISFTITDLGGVSGIGFDNFNPATNDNAANPNPAVNLTVGSSTNTNVNISLKGTDWSGPAAMSLAATSVKFDDDADLADDTNNIPIGTLTTNFQIWYEVTAPAGGAADTTSVSHWVSIPANQLAGDYTSTFTYQAS